jgi:hypothetical protein
MKQFGVLIIVATTVAACDDQQSIWYKSGASQSDYQTDAYECERDTLMRQS